MDIVIPNLVSRTGGEGSRTWLRGLVTEQRTLRSPAQIARLLEIASSRDEAWVHLDGCPSRLREVRQAQQALVRLSPAERAAAFEVRRQQLRSDPA